MESRPALLTPDRRPKTRSVRRFHDSAPKVQAGDRRRHPRIELPDSGTSIVYAVRALLTSLPLVASDIVALLLGLAFADATLAPWLAGAGAGLLDEFLVLTTGLVVANAVLGLYPAVALHGAVELRQSTTAVFLVFGALALADGFRGEGLVVLLTVAVAALTTAVAIPLLRALTRWLCSRFRWWGHPMLVIGAEPVVRQIVEYFDAHPGLGLKPIPLVSDGAEAPEPAAILAKAREHEAVWAALVLGESEGNGDGEPFILRYCASLFACLLVVPEPGVRPSLWTRTTDVGGVAGIQAGTSLLRPVPRVLKRVLDCSLAALMVALSLPLLIGVAFAVKLTSPGPIFYGQERVGRARRRFKAWKFRTMHANADQLLQDCLEADPELRQEWEEDHKLRNDPRITPVGRVLRKTSLDELPQLWNVIRGDMSLVGPRPVVTKEIPKYGQEFGLYLSVPPGLTGLWQVSGRSRTTYEERIAYDTYYVQNWSVWLDLYLLGRTVRAVVTADGAC